MIIHSIDSYKQHKDLIGCKLITYRKLNIPKIKEFLDVDKGDLIVYYAKGKKVIGIFKTTSEIDYLLDDPDWGNMAVYKIEPIILPKKPISIDELIKNPKNNFDLFKNKKYWASYLQGKIIKKLTKHDFDLFDDFIQKKKNNPYQN